MKNKDGRAGKGEKTEEDELVFRREALSVVTDWVQPSHSETISSSKASAPSVINTKTGGVLFKARKEKGRLPGLGLAATSNAKKDKIHHAFTTAAPLTKLLSKKRRRDDGQDEGAVKAGATSSAEKQPQHSGVEEEEGDEEDVSKIQALARRRVDVGVGASRAKEVAAEKGTVGGMKTKKRKKQGAGKEGGKEEEGEGKEGEERGVSTVPAQVSKPSFPVDEKAPRLRPDQGHKARKGHHSQSTSPSSPPPPGHHDGPPPGKRKRTKTRSKQKNIRRDNRPMDQRPLHLRPGTTEFRGRELTDDTKVRLQQLQRKKKGEQQREERG